MAVLPIRQVHPPWDPYTPAVRATGLPRGKPHGLPAWNVRPCTKASNAARPRDLTLRSGRLEQLGPGQQAALKAPIVLGTQAQARRGERVASA